MAVRAPKMIRDSRSLPNWSVPSGCAQLGASIIAPKSLAVGLYGAISSAESPEAAITSTNARPNVPSSSRRKNFSERRVKEACFAPRSSAPAGESPIVPTLVTMTMLLPQLKRMRGSSHA